MKFFYRIYKSSKSKKKAPKIMPEIKSAPVYNKVIFPAKALNKEAAKNEPKYENKIFLTRSSPSKESKRSPSPPRHDLKMIIAKRPSPSYTIEDKSKLNKPNTFVKDFKRLRSNEIKCSEYSSTTSFLPKTIESSSAKKNVTGTVPHDDSKHIKSYDYGRNKKLDKDDESLLNRHLEEKNNIRLMRQRRFSTGERYSKPKKVPEYDVPKLKIELHSLKTKITVPKQPNENYAISPASESLKSPTCTKKVRFMFPIENLKLKFDRKDPKENEKESDKNAQVDLNEYAKRIGLKPVERAAENIVHKKRKKSKHSKEEPSSKKRKLQAEFSSSLDESLKMKVKFTGVKSEKHDRKVSQVYEEKSIKKEEKERPKTIIESRKDLVSDEIRVQNHINPQTNLQPMVCIPNLNLKEMEAAKASVSTSIPNTPQISTKPITSLTTAAVAPISSSVANNIVPKKAEKCVASLACQTPTSFTPRSLTAKMGSPSSSPKLLIPQRTYMISAAQSPNVRPQSMPLSLGLSPISSLQSEQNLKRSLSADYGMVANKQSRPDINDVYERFPNKALYAPNLRQYSNPNHAKMPMLVATSNGKPVDKMVPTNPVSSFSNIAKAHEYYKKYPDIQKRPLPMLIAPSSVSVTKSTDIPVGSSPISMDDRPSVEILRISPNVQVNDKQLFGPPQEQKRQEIKPKPTAIPLAKIKKSGINMQNYMNSNQLIFGSNVPQKTSNDVPKLVSYQLPKPQKAEFKRPQQGVDMNKSGIPFGFATNLYLPGMSPKSNNVPKLNEGSEHFTQNQDLVNLNQQLSIDIAKLSQSLNQESATNSVEKISSYANILTGIATSYTENMRLRMGQRNQPNIAASNTSSNVSRQQNMSVRNVPNPSALMFRQQPQKTINSPVSSPSPSIFANSKMIPNDKKTTFNDIEDFLSKTTIGTTNPITTISNASQTEIKDKQSLTVKKNMHLEKLAANLLAAAENKTSSETLVSPEKATICKIPEKNNNDDSNNNNTNGDIKADKISTKETTDEGKANAKIHVNSSQTERNDA